MNAVEKADRILKDVVFILVAGAIIIYAVNLAFAEETVTKVDEYSAKIVITSVTENAKMKNTNTQEFTATLDELNYAKTASEQALKSWQDEKKKCEANITLQTNQLALAQRLIDEATKQGVVVKPVEEVNPVEGEEPK